MPGTIVPCVKRIRVESPPALGEQAKGTPHLARSCVMGRPTGFLAIVRGVVLGLAGAAALAGPAAAADYGATAPFHAPHYAMAYAPAGAPACHDPAVLARVADGWAWAERVTWRTGLVILAVDRVVDAGPGQYVPVNFQRRFCRAEAALSNGDRERLYYRIEDPAGFAGVGWHVTYCLPGYDRWHVYGQNCLSLRP